MSEPLARFAWTNWVRKHRSTSAATYAAFLRTVRSVCDAIDDEVRDVEITSNMLCTQAGVCPTTMTDWQTRGLLRRARYGYPEHAHAVAILIMRRLFPDKRRNWLPSYVPALPTMLDWWCYEIDPKRDVVYEATIHAPAIGWRITPWNGTTRYGWHALPDGGAIDISGLLPHILDTATSRLATLLASIGKQSES